MKKFVFGLILLILVLSQVALAPFLKIKGVEVNLLLLINIAGVFMFEPPKFILFAFASGLLYDLLGFVPLGTTSLSLIFATTAVFLSKGWTLRHKNLGGVLAALLGIVVYSFTLRILSKFVI